MTKEELTAWWRFFAETECRGYSPLYERIAEAVAQSDLLLDRLLSAPGHAQQPHMLLAAVHDLVLRGGAPELQRHYEGQVSDDVGQLFVEVALAVWPELLPVLERRRVQTNEIGRVALLAPAFATLPLEGPATIVDVGTSAGLTLQLEACHIDYGPVGQLGPPDSPVRIACEVLHGQPPVRPTRVARRIGVDARPLDPSDGADARWLLACTWPDTGRLERTRAALALAAAHPAELRSGDAAADMPALLQQIDGPVVVTTTFALVYLPKDRRLEFFDVLAAASHDRFVAWVSAEPGGVVEALPHVEPPVTVGTTGGVLGAIGYQGGAATNVRVLAHVHPHGKWIWWYDD